MMPVESNSASGTSENVANQILLVEDEAERRGDDYQFSVPDKNSAQLEMTTDDEIVGRLMEADQNKTVSPGLEDKRSSVGDKKF